MLSEGTIRFSWANPVGTIAVQAEVWRQRGGSFKRVVGEVDLSAPFNSSMAFAPSEAGSYLLEVWTSTDGICSSLYRQPSSVTVAEHQLKCPKDGQHRHGTDPCHNDHSLSPPADATCSATSMVGSGIIITTTWKKAQNATSYEIGSPTHDIWTDIGNVDSFDSGVLRVDTKVDYRISIRSKHKDSFSGYVTPSCPQIPNAKDQYSVVQRLGNINNVPGAFTLDQFVEARGTGEIPTNALTFYSYLAWKTDECTSSPDKLLFVGVSFKPACRRHDFNWRNLYRIEHYVLPFVDTWTLANKNAADSRFTEDLEHLCEEAYSGLLRSLVEILTPVPNSLAMCNTVAAIMGEVVSRFRISWIEYCESIGIDDCPEKAVSDASYLQTLGRVTSLDKKVADDIYGLEPIVDEWMATAFGYMPENINGSSTSVDNNSLGAAFFQTDGSESKSAARQQFESELKMAILKALASDPYYGTAAGEIWTEGPLVTAYRSGLESCYSQTGITIPNIFSPEVATEEERAAARRLMEEQALASGIEDDDWMELATKCVAYANDFPTLDAVALESTYRGQREYYLTALEDWVKDNPDKAVEISMQSSN